LLPRLAEAALLPARVTIEAPTLVPEMSNAPPFTVTPDELAIEPLPVSARVLPLAIVVAPV
jgi:hypothetical protein